MKKLFVLLLGLVLSVALVGCSSPLENTEKDYYVTGNFNGWDTVADTGLMEAIAKNDDRVASIKDELSGVEFLYLKEITLTTDADWNVNYIVSGVNTVFNGNLTVKVIRTTAGDPDARDWWSPSPESGQIDNLTPSTLFMPEYVSEATTSVTVGDVTYTTGDHNGNPVALTAGTYYAVFAEFGDGSRALGLIEVPAA